MSHDKYHDTKLKMALVVIAENCNSP